MEQNIKTKVYNLLIVDESGSMGVIQKEALSGLNETIATCQSIQEKYPNLEQRVHLVTFDSGHYKVHYDNLNVKDAHPLTEKDYCPGGCTPLYDAIGKGVSTINALAGEGDKVLVTIITDGMENASREYNLKMVKNLIEKLKKEGWTFTLIGTDNLDVDGMAHSMSIDHKLAFAEDDEGTRRMWATERFSRQNFNACLSFAKPIDKYFKDEE